MDKRPLGRQEVERAERAYLAIQKAMKKKPLVVFFLLALCGYLFLRVCQDSGISPLQYFWPRLDVTLVMMKWGALRPLRVYQGEYWRLVACIFLHHGLVHLLCNSIALYSLGSLIEKLYGKINLVILFFLTGLCGSTATWLFQDPYIISAGASGAIFGLIGVALVFSIQHRKELPPGMASRLFRSLAFWTALGLGLGAVIPGIDNMGHLGGLVGGLVFGPFFCPRNLLEEEKLSQKIVTGLVGIALVVFGLVVFSPSSKAYSWKSDFQTYQNRWFKLKYPPGWHPKETKTKDKFTLLFREGPVVEIQVADRTSKQDLTSFIDFFFDARQNQFASKGFYKIPRQDRIFPFQKDGKGPKTELLGKKFGYSYRDPKGQWQVIEVEVLFTEKWVYILKYARIERDKMAKKFFSAISESVIIRKGGK